MELSYKGTNISIEDANNCPHCQVTINPGYLWSAFTRDTDDIEALISVWLCPQHKCGKMFVALYKLEGSNNFVFSRFLNGFPKGPDWPKPITELKSGQQIEDEPIEQSKFIRTYLQSLIAENSGLDELAGVGFRKAIEYLVKDWAIQNNYKDKDIIIKSWLGKIINNYYEKELKEILKRATWLGNDQAHYYKLFGEYSIKDLKELIDLIMVEIDRQYKKAHYIENIQSRN